MRLIQYLIVMALLLIPASAVRAAFADIGNQDTVHPVANSVDVTSAVETGSFVTFSSPAEQKTGLAGSFLRQMQSEVGAAIPERVLSTAEERAVGVWNLPGGGISLVFSTLNLVVEYNTFNGKLPANGMDLFPEIQSTAGRNALRQAEPDDIIDRFSAGISPITGRFYSSFTAEDWCCGAMCIRIIEDPAEIERLRPGMRMPIDPLTAGEDTRPVQRLVHVKIWGEQPGAVVYDGILLN